MTSLRAGPLPFDTGICIQFAAGQTPVEPEQSTISPLGLHIWLRCVPSRRCFLLGRF